MTVSDSQGQGLPFYQQMLEVWQQQSQELDYDSPLIHIQEPVAFL
jgi:hypothetical protein